LEQAQALSLIADNISMSLFEITSADAGEFYHGLAVIESGTKWCICQLD
jgi:hypothetical protein